MRGTKAIVTNPPPDNLKPTHAPDVADEAFQADSWRGVRIHQTHSILKIVNDKLSEIWNLLLAALLSASLVRYFVMPTVPRDLGPGWFVVPRAPKSFVAARQISARY